MDAPAMRGRIVKSLLRTIEDTNFPSTAMLDRVEGAVATQEELTEYVEILLNKVEGTRYPSTQLLDRLDQIASKLPVGQAEG